MSVAIYQWKTLQMLKRLVNLPTFQLTDDYVFLHWILIFCVDGAILIQTT